MDELKAGNIGWIMLDETPFYAQSGGQIYDTGLINGSNKVTDTQKFFGLNLSEVETSTNLKVGDIVKCEVDEARIETARHHSATHLLHLALREILGSGVGQAGSSVDSERLRFDFTYPKSLTSEQLLKIENNVNSQISKGGASKTEIMDINEARKSGAIAMFSEKYGDKVRVLTLGESKEFCGGTHVRNLWEIGSFYIVKESGVSAGVRRIEAVCSKAAINYAKNFRSEFLEVQNALKSNEALSAIKKLKDEIKSLKNEISKASAAKVIDLDEKDGIKFVISEFDGDIKIKIDELKNENDKIVAVFFKVEDGKVQIAAGVKNAPLKAGEIVKQIAKILGGGGGGRDDFATAGGKDTTKIDEAVNFARDLIKAKI